MAGFLNANSWVVALLLVWILAWKGWALWVAARKSQKIWYIALLIINTLGILEILYIYVFSKGSKPSAPVANASKPKL